MEQESYCRALIRRCAETGSEESWREFVGRFKRPIERGILRALRASSQNLRGYEREDLTQDVFCRLLDHGRRRLRWCRGRTEDQIASYLCRVAETVTIDHLRAQAALKRRSWIFAAGAPATVPGDPIDRLEDPAPGPEQRAIHRELGQALEGHCRNAVSSATGQRDLEIFRLAIVEGWSSREIAERVGDGLSASGVDSVICRLRRRLQRQGLNVPRRSRPPLDGTVAGTQRGGGL